MMMDTTVGAEVSFDEDKNRKVKRQRIRKRKACERCHSKKIRCNFEKPCSTCVASHTEDTCEYLVVQKPVIVNVKKEYIEDLLTEVEMLKKQLSLVTAQLLTQPGVPGKPKQSEVTNPMSISTILDNRRDAEPNDNPLVTDQNIPQSTSQFNYMGDSACSKFNTKLQQYVQHYCGEAKDTELKFVDIPQPTRYDSDDLHWNNYKLHNSYVLPDKSEVHTLIDIAYKQVGIEYYFVMIDSFNKLVDRIYANYKPGKKISTTPKDVTRSQMAQLFAMCALGCLYSGSNTDGGRQVPGIKYFKLAVSLLRDEFEEPCVEYIEALSQIAFYSYSLNRVKSSFVYTGLALRLAVSMGMHRRASFWNNTRWDLKGRERGRRLFYTLYIFDKLICSKLGYPVSIEDDDIDTELPSELYFTDSEFREFPNSKYVLAQIEIATVSNLISKHIYGIGQMRIKDEKRSFVKNVHHVLSRLRDCYERLDPTLKLAHYNNRSLHLVLRNIFSFHMHYNQLVILATRPLLLYVFTRSLSNWKFQPSQLTLAIADACIQSAYSINSVINTLHKTGKLACYGFFDAHYCFSSTIILYMAVILTRYDETTKADIDSRIANATNILRILSDLGSIPASHFVSELANLHATFERIDTNRVAKVFRRTDNDSFPAQDVLSVVEDNVPTDAHNLVDDADLLQVAGTFSLDDEVLQDFLNSNLDNALESMTFDSADGVFNFDDFDQMRAIFNDF